MRAVALISLLLACCSQAGALKLPQLSKTSKAQTILKVDLNSDIMKETAKPIIIEIVAKRSATQTKKSATKAKSRTASGYSQSLYKESKQDVVANMMDSPLLKVFGVLFNPTTLVLALYFSSIGWSQVLWLQKILKVFGKGSLAGKKKDGSEKKSVDPVEDLPFQVFECEVCGMEMRPARGRAEAILGRERFRCSRCGAKASSYFNVDDLNDPRAVARLERLKAQEEMDEADITDDGDDDDTEDEEDDDEDAPPKKSGRR